MRTPLPELIAPDWAEALAPVAPVIAQMGDFLRSELAAGRGYSPAGPNVLRAFSRPWLRCGYSSSARILIERARSIVVLGGSTSVRCPAAWSTSTRSCSPTSIPPAESGILTGWFEQGVLLLNRVLTVRPGFPGSHRGKGWETVTERAIDALAARGGPLVAVLWGRDAQSLAPRLAGIPQIASAHPSPMSARAGFFGSRPFSRANSALQAQGGTAIDWRLA